MLKRSSILSFIFFLYLCSFLAYLPGEVYAQSTFSGSDIKSYQCPKLTSDPEEEKVEPVPEKSGNGEVFYCIYETADGQVKRLATPKPPQLRVLEFWFIRIIYSLWALSGIFFTFTLIWIGFQYMTSYGNVVELADVIKRFRYWMIGIALVFLSYPALNTFFSLLQVDTSQDCYQELEGNLIGFQFFFPQACGTQLSGQYGEASNACNSTCNSVKSAFPNLNCSDVCARVIDYCITEVCPAGDSGTAQQSCITNVCLNVNLISRFASPPPNCTGSGPC